MVASIMRHVAEKTRTPMETLYQEIGWPLNKRYGHAVDAFKLSITYAHPIPSLPSSHVISKVLTEFLQKPRRLDRHHLPLPRRKIRTPILHLQAPNPSTHKSPRRRRSNLFRVRRHRRRQNLPPRRRSPQHLHARRTGKSKIGVSTTIRINESMS